MIDIGEDLVGAYLSRIENCWIVQFNVRTGVAQAEIDVVGLALEGTRVARVWLCEVSTHTGGLGGYGGDAAREIRKKVASVRRYADSTFPDVPRIIEVCSPKVSPAMSKNERGRSGWVGRGAGAHAPALAYRECRIGYAPSSLLQYFDQHRLQPRSEAAVAELNRPRLTVKQIVDRVATEGVFAPAGQR